MNLKDLKNKLKNKVQESKTKQFVEEHKSDITTVGVVCLSAATSIWAGQKIFVRGYKAGVSAGVRSAGIAIDTALTANNVNSELQAKLAKDSGKVLSTLLDSQITIA